MAKTKSIDEECLDACKEILGFLINEYSFTGPEIEGIGTNSIAVNYYKKEIAILSSLDVNDEGISFRIAHLENGKIPNVWRMNKKGEVVIEYLHSLLKHRGVGDFRYEKPPYLPNLSKRENEFRRSLVAHIFWLKKYGEDILEGSAVIFEGYDEPGDHF